jgi:hypothetical protein
VRFDSRDLDTTDFADPRDLDTSDNSYTSDQQSPPVSQTAGQRPTVCRGLSAGATPAATPAATYDANAGTVVVNINNAGDTAASDVAQSTGGIRGFSATVPLFGSVVGYSDDINVTAVTDSNELKITATLPGSTDRELVISIINDAADADSPTANYDATTNTLQIHVSPHGRTALTSIAASVTQLETFSAIAIANGEGYIDGGTAAANPARSIVYEPVPPPTQTAEPRPPWQNPIDPFDVDSDGRSGISDLVLVMNFLRENGSGLLPAEQNGAAFVDVDGDRRAQIADAVLLASKLYNAAPLCRHTPKTLNSTAQGRAAHPRKPRRVRAKPQRSFSSAIGTVGRGTPTRQIPLAGKLHRQTVARRPADWLRRSRLLSGYSSYAAAGGGFSGFS